MENIVLNLILKDSKIGKKGIIYGSFICLILGSSFLAQTRTLSSMYTIGVMFFVFCAVEGANGYDDLNKSYIILNSLPLNRESIVKSKYIEVILYSSIGEVLLSAFLNLIKLINLERYGMDFNFNIYIVMGSMAYIMIYYSIYYILYFKFGGYKLRYIKQFVYFILIMLPSIIFATLKRYSGLKIIKFIIEFKFNNVYLLLGASILMFISFTISKKIYENKDL